MKFNAQKTLRNDANRDATDCRRFSPPLLSGHDDDRSHILAAAVPQDKSVRRLLVHGVTPQMNGKYLESRSVCDGAGWFMGTRKH